MHDKPGTRLAIGLQGVAHRTGTLTMVWSNVRQQSQMLAAKRFTIVLRVVLPRRMEDLNVHGSSQVFDHVCPIAVIKQVHFVDGIYTPVGDVDESLVEGYGKWMGDAILADTPGDDASIRAVVVDNGNCIQSGVSPVDFFVHVIQRDGIRPSDVRGNKFDAIFTIHATATNFRFFRTPVSIEEIPAYINNRNYKTRIN